MKKKQVKMIGTMLVMALLTCLAGKTVSAKGNFEDTMYSYISQNTTEGYSDTAWRTKDYQLSSDTRGYAYVYCTYKEASYVRLRGCLHDSTLGTRTNTNPCSNWAIIPYYAKRSLYNWYTLASYNEVKLRVTTADRKGETGGAWSPDCSQVYTVIGN